MNGKMLLLVLSILFAGCAAETADTPPDCEYSHSHSFGYSPPPPAEKERLYSDEPTLFQQEPDLAK
jgi:hypothetical protein